jgi:hypothetical protein
MKNATLALTLAVILTISSAAQATMVTYYGTGLNEVVKVHAPGTLADHLWVPAGQERISLLNHDFIAYCVDLNHYAATGEMEITDASILPRGNLVAYLMETYAPTVTDNHAAAVLGVSLWELVTEMCPELDIFSGSFYITNNPSVAADAQSLLASLPTEYQPDVFPTVLYGEGIRQDFVLPNVNIPEPATLAIIGFGATFMSIRRKW